MTNFSINSVLTNGTMSISTSKPRLRMDELDKAYVAVTFVMSVMSILGSLVILAIHWLYADLRTVGRSMLMHLTVADFLTAIGNLLGVLWYLNVDVMTHKMAYCKFHSALTIMSSISSFMWTVVIAWFVFWIVLRGQPSINQRHKGCCSKVASAVCWGVPVLISVVALFENVLGYDQNLSQASWCWIDPTIDHPLLWMLVTGKAWEVGACIATICFYTGVKVIIFRKRQKVAANHHSRKIEEANMKLTFVPLVFIVIRIWGTIRFLLGNFAHDYASSPDADWIVILQGTGDSAQGFANCVIYCVFTQKIRQRLIQTCRCAVSPSLHVHCVSRNSGSNYKFSQKGHEGMAAIGPYRRCSNRVLPAMAGTDPSQRRSQEQFRNNQQTESENSEDTEKKHLECLWSVNKAQSLHAAPSLPPEATSVPTNRATETTVTGISIESSHIQTSINPSLQNDTDSSGKLFSLVHNSEGAGHNWVVLPENTEHIWTTSGSQAYISRNSDTTNKMGT